MDGNGRWASRRGLPRTAGHKVGAEALRNIVSYCREIGVKYLTVYAFSTENWKRSAAEVELLMSLCNRYLREAIESMERDRTRLYFFGDMTPISPELRALAHQSDEISATMPQNYFRVNVCLNYGGRDEIIRAARKFAQDCAAGRRNPAELDETLFSAILDTRGVPDPDIIIRPGGELRLSNFLLWQSAYSELYFTDTLWPDFDEREIDRAILAYRNRERRFGNAK